jgi:signal transduction histidine kinase
MVDISDNGNGFDIKKVNDSVNNGIGLKNIYTMVKSHDGNINIESNVDAGTHIKIAIPLYEYEGEGAEVV